MRRNSILSVVVSLMAVPLLAAGLAAAWVNTTLFDTQRYVEVLAPLSDDTEVESFLIETVRQRVEDGVDLPELPFLDTTEIERGIVEAAVSQTRAFVESDSFDELWRAGIQEGHETFMAAVNDPEASGAIRFDLSPVADRVDALPNLPEQFTALVQDGLRRQADIVLLRSRWLAQLQRNAGIVRWAALVLPMIAVVLLAIAVVASPNRLRSLAIVGVAILGSAAALFFLREAAKSAMLVISRLPDNVTLSVYQHAMAGTGAWLGWLAGAGGVLLLIGLIPVRRRAHALRS